LETRQHCPNSVGILTTVQITMDFGQCSNSGAQILTAQFPIYLAVYTQLGNSWLRACQEISGLCHS
jgi:hypothetical protein